MRVLIELDERRETVEIDGFAPTAALGALVHAATGIHLEPAVDLFVDERAATAETPLRDVVLLEGTRIARAPQTRAHRVQGWSVTLAGGTSASALAPLPSTRRLVVGRAPQADLVLQSESASWEHCSFEREGDGVRIRDAGSTNGTVVDGVRLDADGLLVTDTTSVVVGGAVLLLRPRLAESTVPAPGTLPNLTPAATAPFNRPPRPGRSSEAGTVVPPERKDVPPASKFSFITVLAPLAIAGAMVLLLGDARFALFALLSPVTAIGMWFEQRQRRARNLREEEKRFSEAVQTFRTEIAQEARAETDRRRDLVPDPATVLRRASLPTTLLWQRRSDDDDFLALHAGTGDSPWRPEVDERASSRHDDEVKAALADSRLSAAPVVADLSDAGVVGIVGDRAGALALARSLLAQAAVHCGPADLTVGVFCDQGRGDDWSWASWLPHTRVAGSSTGERWMSAQRDGSAAVLRGMRESLDDLPTPHLLVLIDSEVLTEGRDAPARSLLGQGRSTPETSRRVGERPRRVSGIVIATSEQQLPAACTTIVSVGVDAAATVSRPEDRVTVEDVVLAGIDSAAAERCALDLAHLDDPELTVPGASLPSLVRLPDLLREGATSPPRRSSRRGRRPPGSRRPSARPRRACSTSTWSATDLTASSEGPPGRARASSCGRSWQGSPRGPTRLA
ncbi:hypothetical protein GCM10025867_17780 [Frondihabitans sucicola]|uniref:FHA domain-containing protein n=1 Tax=Frondihabitans sucicola TaxID=1268041 RepID=A0ABM8GM93_9MICO|nr:FHA domain-containing protein [Frondihabitans sucicola]BDZ49537.1 hypothetical protein GCM10025867_17780 [Frondihabitans sucicola]